MNPIEYVDLPQVPTDLLESLQEIIDKPLAESIIPVEYVYFQTKHIPKKLYTFLESIFPFAFYCKYQLIRNGIDNHKDQGRNLAFNYILDPGGANVVTNVYDDNNNIIQSVNIQPFKWVRFETDKLHGVHGVEGDRVRIAISVTPATSIVEV